MSDNIIKHPIQYWLPAETWNLIASLLDNNELARFRQVCKLFYGIGSQAMMLQPLYNRLRAIDSALPADLQTQTAGKQMDKTPLTLFKETFEKIQTKQQQEIAYLTQHHGARMTTLTQGAHASVLQKNTSVTLKSLEAEHALLDAINSEIVTACIDDVNSTRLDLNNADITRLPVTLFTAAGYVHFWQNLTHLYCEKNQLTALDVTELAALKKLYCHDNQLIALNVQGLAALQGLWCSNNQLITLNMQGSTALKWLDCTNNKLTALNVTELAALQTLWCGYNQLTTMDIQGFTALQWLDCANNKLTALNVTGLAALEELFCKNNQLTALNVTGLVALQRLDFNNNPLTDLNLTDVPMAIKNQYAELERSLLFNQLNQAGSTALPSVSAVYLPSSAISDNAPNTQQKRPRDEEQTQDDNQMKQDDNSSATPEQEPGDEPEAKRRKKS